MKMSQSKFESIPVSKFVSLLVALTAPVGAMAAAHAATGAKRFFEQQELWSGGGQ